MSEDVKQAYQDKMDAQLREVEANFAGLKARADKAGAEARIDAQRHLDSLEAKRGVLAARFELLKASGAEKFEELRQTVDHGWQELKAAADQLTSHLGSR